MDGWILETPRVFFVPGFWLLGRSKQFASCFSSNKPGGLDPSPLHDAMAIHAAPALLACSFLHFCSFLSCRGGEGGLGAAAFPPIASAAEVLPGSTQHGAQFIPLPGSSIEPLTAGQVGLGRGYIKLHHCLV